MAKKIDKIENKDIDYQKYLNLFSFDYKKILLELWTFSKIYLFWILIHYISSNLYSHFCTHLSLVGLFLSPIMAISPQCKALHWLTVNSIVNINNMWVAITGWIMLKIKTE
jgi:hypothetical protein